MLQMYKREGNCRTHFINHRTVARFRHERNVLLPSQSLPFEHLHDSCQRVIQGCSGYTDTWLTLGQDLEWLFKLGSGSHSLSLGVRVYGELVPT